VRLNAPATNRGMFVIAMPSRGSSGLGASAIQEMFDKLFNKKKSKAREEKRDLAVKNYGETEQVAQAATFQIQQASQKNVMTYLVAGAAAAGALVLLAELLSPPRGR